MAKLMTESEGRAQTAKDLIELAARILSGDGEAISVERRLEKERDWRGRPTRKILVESWRIMIDKPKSP